MRLARLSIGQGPSKGRVIAEAGGHVFIAGIVHEAQHRKRRIHDLEMHLQLEPKWIDLSRGLIPAQTKGRGDGSRLDLLEQCRAGESMTRQCIALRTKPVPASRERADDGE